MFGKCQTVKNLQCLEENYRKKHGLLQISCSIVFRRRRTSETPNADIVFDAAIHLVGFRLQNTQRKSYERTEDSFLISVQFLFLMSLLPHPRPLFDIVRRVDILIHVEAKSLFCPYITTRIFFRNENFSFFINKRLVYFGNINSLW